MRLPVIGVLWLNSLPFPMADFRQGLANQGLVIGENLAIDFEFPIRLAQLPAHAARLVEVAPPPMSIAFYAARIRWSYPFRPSSRWS